MRVFLLIVVFFVAAYAHAQDEEKRTDEVRALIRNIKLELSAVADHPWAALDAGYVRTVV